VGSPILSYLSNNIFKARKPLLILASIINVIITGSLFFFTQGIPIPLLYLICLGIGIFLGAVTTIGFTTNKELFPVSIAGTATGLINIFPFLGGAIFQIVLGAVLDSQGVTPSGAFTLQGFRYAFLVLFVCGSVACVASFLIQETMKAR
jgi:sugar phosphate permease